MTRNDDSRAASTDKELEAPAFDHAVSQAAPRRFTPGEMISRGAEFIVTMLART